MSILAQPAPVSNETPPPAPRAVSRSTLLFLEKLEVAKQIMQMNHDEQQRNLDMARQFAEIAKSVGWPQAPG